MTSFLQNIKRETDSFVIRLASVNHLYVVVRLHCNIWKAACQDILLDSQAFLLDIDNSVKQFLLTLHNYELYYMSVKS